MAAGDDDDDDERCCSRSTMAMITNEDETKAQQAIHRVYFSTTKSQTQELTVIN